jgi:hypothetical protein
MPSKLRKKKTFFLSSGIGPPNVPPNSSRLRCTGMIPRALFAQLLALNELSRRYSYALP